MRKSLLVCFILSFCILFTYAGNSDDNREIKKLYRKGQYALICNHYENNQGEKYTNADLLRIGDSYYYTKRYKKASEIYNRYVSYVRKGNIKSDCVERFFNSMFRAKEYEKIFTVYSIYKNKIPVSYKTENILASAEYLVNNKLDNSWKYNMVRDSVFEDLCCSYGLGVIDGNAVYYTYKSEEAYRAISSEKGYKYMPETLNKLNYINGLRPKIFESFSGSMEQYYRTLEGLNKSLKHNFISNYALSPKEKYVVFTDFSGSRSHTRLCYLKKKNGEWGNIKTLNFCKSSCDYGMPVFDKSGKRLYFISNMKSGYGGWDLYYSEKSENGRWSAPINVGSEINTPGDEMYPYIDNSGRLYFSSDGHPGYGGFDIYEVEGKDGKLKVNNLSYPINSEDDDISCVYNTDEDKLFVLTRFMENKQAKAVLKKYLVVEDRKFCKKCEKSKEPIVGEKNKSSQMNSKAASISKEVSFANGSNKTVIAKKSGDIENNSSKIKPDIVSRDVVKGVDKKVKLNNYKSLHLLASKVHFDFDSYRLKIGGKESIKNVINNLKSEENCVFNITGYADTTGNERYNLWLSKKRAECIGNYIVSKYGIEPENICITARGEFLSKSDSKSFRRVDVKVYNRVINPFKFMITYVTKKDMCIKELAKMFNVRDEIIRILNTNKINDDIFKKGSIITIPVKALHKISKGETLKTVVKKYSVDEINVLMVNNLKKSKKLSKSTVLYIPFGVDDEKMPLSLVKSKNIDIK